MRLTKNEIILIVIVLSIAVGGAGAKHYREVHPTPKALPKPKKPLPIWRQPQAPAEK